MDKASEAQSLDSVVLRNMLGRLRLTLSKTSQTKLVKASRSAKLCLAIAMITLLVEINLYLEYPDVVTFVEICGLVLIAVGQLFIVRAYMTELRRRAVDT